MEIQEQRLQQQRLVKEIIKSYPLYIQRDNMHFRILDAPKAKGDQRYAGQVVEEHSGALIRMQDIPPSWLYIRSKDTMIRLFQISGKPAIVKHSLSGKYIAIKWNVPILTGDLAMIDADIASVLGVKMSKTEKIFTSSALFFTTFVGTLKDYQEANPIPISNNMQELHDHTMVVSIAMGTVDILVELDKCYEQGIYILQQII